MWVQLTLVGAGALDAYPRAKCFEVCDFGLAVVSTFNRSLAGSQVDMPVVQVDGLEQGSRPKLCWEAQPIEKGADLIASVLYKFLHCHLGKGCWRL
jgi:hypothetical protein